MTVKWKDVNHVSVSVCDYETDQLILDSCAPADATDLRRRLDPTLEFGITVKEGRLDWAGSRLEEQVLH